MTSRNDAFDLHVKLLLLGDTGVGKTCLLLQYAYSTFSPTFITTIGIDYKIKHIAVDGVNCKLQIWDTAGQERFRTITVSYFKGAHGVVLVYDVTDRASFESIRHWVSQLKLHAKGDVNVALLGNKCDREDRMVKKDEGESLAKVFGYRFFETSAKGGICVDDAFEFVAKETARRLIKEGEDGGPKARQSEAEERGSIKLTREKNNKSGCC